MAEPLGVVASVIAISKLMKEVIKVIREIKDAPRECGKMLAELSMTSGLLDSIQYLLENHPEKEWPSPLRDLCRPSNGMEQFESVIQLISSRLAPSARLSKIGKAITWPFNKGDLDRAMQDIERLKQTLTLALEISTAEQVHLLDTRLDEIKSQGLNREASELRQRILGWLSQLEPHKKHNSVREKRIKDTGNWFLQHDEFRQWRENEAQGGLLCCMGDPGAGKTVLSSLAIEFIRRSLPDDEAIAYFYCDYQEKEAQTAANIIASLARQLLSFKESIPEAIRAYNANSNDGQLSPGVRELETILTETCRSFHQVYFVIDALDECNALEHRPLLLRTLNNLHKQSGKLLVTSRPSASDVHKTLVGGRQLSISAHEADIRKFVEQRIDENMTAQEIMDEEMQEVIVNAVTKQSKGMFLVPMFHIQTILEETSLAGMKRALKKLPKDLYTLFDTIMDRIRSQASSRAELGMATIMWVAHSLRPLPMAALRQALAIRPEHTSLDNDECSSPAHIIECCFGLVSLDEETSTVRLFHASVQDFLDEKWTTLFPDADFIMARTCLTFLIFSDLSIDRCSSYDDFLDRVRQYPFLPYASQNWSHHAKRVLDNTHADGALITAQIETRKSQQTHLKLIFSRFIERTRNLAVSEQAFLVDKQNPDYIGGYKHDGDGDIKSLQAFMIRRAWQSFNMRTRDEQSALHVAAFWGLNSLIRNLLEAQPAENIDATNSYNETPLYRAIAGNAPTQTINMLLQANADPNQGPSPSESPLKIAIQRGTGDIVRTLLQAGASTEWTWDEYDNFAASLDTDDPAMSTALRLATLLDNQEIVDALRPKEASSSPIPNALIVP